MSNYEELSIKRKKLQEEGSLPDWYQTAGYQLLSDKYLYENSTLKETFQRMADTAAKHLYGKIPDEEAKYLHKRFNEIIWEADLAPASPVYNLGTPRGLPVSCSGGYVKDQVPGFYEHRTEMAVLTQEQFGTSGYLGAVRPRGSKISRGGTAAGMVNLFNGLATDMQEITQGTTRRGSYAGYIPVSHGDFHELLNSIMAEPEGKNLGINYHDEDVKVVLSGDENHETFKRYQKHMKLRAVYGKGYFYFPDRVARLQPKMYVDEKEFTFVYNLDDVIGSYVDYKENNVTVSDLLKLFDSGERVRLSTDTKTLLDIFSYEKLSENTVKIFTKRILRSHASNLCVKGNTVIRIQYNELEHDIEIADFVSNWNVGLYTNGVKVLSENKDFKNVSNAGKTGVSKKMIRITSECGKSIECTYNHPVKTKNRGYVEAKDLVETDELDLI